MAAGLLLSGCGARSRGTAWPDAERRHDSSREQASPLSVVVLDTYRSGSASEDRLVELRWSNDSADDVVISAYRLSWPGGFRMVEAQNLVLHPRETITRLLRVDHASGRLDRLDASAHVTIVSAIKRAPTPPLADELAVCRQLLSSDPHLRGDAAERLSLARPLISIGRSEEHILSAAAAYCEREFRVRVTWWAR